MNLIFWHNIISPHQAPFMRALTEVGHEVIVVATEAMSEDRLKLGWSIPDLGTARMILGPDAAAVRDIIQSSSSDSVHFIAGARGTPLGKQVALTCRAARRRMGIITESPDPRGLAGLLRRAKYSVERIGIGRSFDFILAMGETGVRWFKHCGYPAHRIFPFAYVTERPSTTTGENSEDSLQFLFIGRLVELKGLDMLFGALAQTEGMKLEIVGDGPQHSLLCDLAKRLGISSRVRWLGQLGQVAVPPRISRADVLILPSHKDGWGAVVNEALMAGTPVICSTACGAEDLIQYPWLGSVFRSGDVTDLAHALQAWVSAGKRTAAERERIRNWSQCIEGPTMARYVEQILHHVYDGGARPQAPWRIKAS